MAVVADGDEDGLNAMIASVKGLEPRDALEAALATQMAAVHALTCGSPTNSHVLTPSRGKSMRSGL
jgi:hypothetical protein